MIAGEGRAFCSVHKWNTGEFSGLERDGPLERDRPLERYRPLERDRAPSNVVRTINQRLVCFQSSAEALEDAHGLTPQLVPGECPVLS